MSDLYNEIQTRGWSEVDFDLTEGHRAEYAQLANAVIQLAVEDEHIKDALSFDMSHGSETGLVRTATYGLMGALNSGDEKYTLHAGFQSRNHADSIMAERNQPGELRDFWEVHEGMLYAIEQTVARTLGTLGAAALVSEIFAEDPMMDNVHVRTVRYIHATSQPVGKEVISGHGDLGLATLHIFETHGGWLNGGAYPSSVMLSNDTFERGVQVRAIRSNLRSLESESDTIPFFLGATWQTFPEVPEILRGLPGCYHAGFRPDANQEVISPAATEVAAGKPDRISVISFLHPNLSRLGTYAVPTVSNCRPQY